MTSSLAALESARQTLRSDIETAKKKFETSTGTVLTKLEVSYVSHFYAGGIDCSVLSNFGVEVGLKGSAGTSYWSHGLGN